MSRSWDHAARRLTEAEIARAEQQDRHSAEVFGEPGYRYDALCRMAKCQQAATHQIRYSYVTGRAGRVSWAAKNTCTAHAEKFAARHGIEITDAPPREHATQQAVQAAYGTMKRITE